MTRLYAFSLLAEWRSSKQLIACLRAKPIDVFLFSRFLLASITDSYVRSAGLGSRSFPLLLLWPEIVDFHSFLFIFIFFFTPLRTCFYLLFGMA